MNYSQKDLININNGKINVDMFKVVGSYRPELNALIANAIVRDPLVTGNQMLRGYKSPEEWKAILSVDEGYLQMKNMVYYVYKNYPTKCRNMEKTGLFSLREDIGVVFGQIYRILDNLEKEGRKVGIHYLVMWALNHKYVNDCHADTLLSKDVDLIDTLGDEAIDFDFEVRTNTLQATLEFKELVESVFGDMDTFIYYLDKAKTFKTETLDVTVFDKFDMETYITKVGFGRTSGEVSKLRRDFAKLKAMTVVGHAKTPRVDLSLLYHL